MSDERFKRKVLSYLQLITWFAGILMAGLVLLPFFMGLFEGMNS